MMVRYIAFAVLLSLALITVTVPLHAECLGSTIPNAKRRATNVFEATATSIKALEHGEFVATLNVHRVWKGDAASETTVYFMPSMNGPALENGGRFIFFAEPLNPISQKVFGLPADHPRRSNWIPPCIGMARPLDSVVKQLGRSRKPNDRRIF
ncbi:MAG: hypothetical protein M3541_07725 [Acidobacteriota bacterium]|nr:hypothetical protein [Acidobacteriota bacterium]MDQ3418657.1 hypothetical protein [Acidobacteriota bacterium]